MYLFGEQDWRSANQTLGQVLESVAPGIPNERKRNAVRWIFNVVFRVFVTHPQETERLRDLSTTIHDLCRERLRIARGFDEGGLLTRFVRRGQIALEEELLLSGLTRAASDLTETVGLFDRDYSIFEASAEHRDRVRDLAQLISQPPAALTGNAQLFADLLATPEPIGNLLAVAVLATHSAKAWEQVVALVKDLFEGTVRPSVQHDRGFLQDRLFGVFTYSRPPDPEAWHSVLQDFTRRHIEEFRQFFVEGPRDPIGKCHTPLTPITKLETRIKGRMLFAEDQLSRAMAFDDGDLCRRIVSCLALEGMHSPAQAASLLDRFNPRQFRERGVLDDVLGALSALRVLAPDAVDRVLYRWAFVVPDAEGITSGDVQRAVAARRIDLVERAALFWPFMDCAALMLERQTLARTAIARLAEELPDYVNPDDIHQGLAGAVYSLLLKSDFSISALVGDDLGM